MDQLLEAIKVKIDLDAFERLLDERQPADAVASVIRRRLGLPLILVDHIGGSFQTCTICETREHDSWGRYDGKAKRITDSTKIPTIHFHCGRCAFISNRGGECSEYACIDDSVNISLYAS